MFQRRVLTLSSLVVISFLAVALLPVVVIATLAMSTSPKFRTAPQAMTFIYGFLLREWAGLTLFIWVLLRYPKSRHIEKNRAIQFWWAQSLFNLCLLYTSDAADE